MGGPQAHSNQNCGVSLQREAVTEDNVLGAHSIRAQLRNVGGEYFLKLEPGYVFTRDGSSMINSSDAGALSTSRMSQERNYQVLTHLYFWTWFLARDTALWGSTPS